MFTRWFNCTGQIPLLCTVVNLEFWLANSNFAPGLNVGSLSDRVRLPCQRGWGFYGSLAGLFIFLRVGCILYWAIQSLHYKYFMGLLKQQEDVVAPLCPPSCKSLNLRWTSVVRGTSGSVCVHPPPPLPPPPPPSLRASEELSCLGVIQKKMTVNATDDSYDKARQSMAQAEEETRSRGAIVIKHGGRYQGQCVTRCCTCSTAWQTAAVTETPPKKKKKPTVSHISGYHGNQWHSNSKSWFFWRYFITFFSVQFLPSNTGFSILCSNFDDF